VITTLVIAVRCSGSYHHIVNLLDKRGYEADLHEALRSARPLTVKDPSLCVAAGGPDILLQSQNSR